MYKPASTYRIQFNKNFTLADLRQILPYLNRLGISAIYASPIFESVPGSTHGYDVVNSCRINPEIGSLDELYEIKKHLDKYSMGWIQDIVPNHMAFHPANTWLMDVMEKGHLSLYYEWFDIGRPGKPDERLMVPFLGSGLEELIENGEISLLRDDVSMGLEYAGNIWPLNIRSYSIIFGIKSPSAKIENFISQAAEISHISDPVAYDRALAQWKDALYALFKQKVFRQYVQDCIDLVNGDKSQLRRIINSQEYRLCHWRETDIRINYRRFFTVNGLICLNMDNGALFQQYHQLTAKLVSDGIFTGLRIDHIDGLSDPTGYLDQLRELCGPQTFITVEKILEREEDLARSWPVQGTTGYDFLAQSNNLFIAQDAAGSFVSFYEEIIGKARNIDEQIYLKKAYILNSHLAGELDNLVALFMDLDLAPDANGQTGLRAAIGAFLIYFSVYRLYARSLPFRGSEQALMNSVFYKMRKDRGLNPAAIDLVEGIFLQQPLKGDADFNQRVLRFFRRCMQFTGPLTAKGVEDTLMYVDACFISHNEVGDSLDSFGISTCDFHDKMENRLEFLSLSLSASSTHDTKRGEDMRARLNVLSDIPAEWLPLMSESLRVDPRALPDANDRYFIYQTIAGSFPMPGEVDMEYKQRLQEYLVKAFREAKRYSNWSEPDVEFEEAVKNFTESVLQTGHGFWNKFQILHPKLADHGIINSLSQVLLKCTCPGIPDIYQGSEGWDLSFVDPDNRRSVDYDVRAAWLDSTESSSQAEFLKLLWGDRYKGKIKLWLLQSVLNERKSNNRIFSDGEYIRLEVKGKFKQHVLAFARRYKRKWYLTAVPLHTARIPEFRTDIPGFDWKDTRIILSATMPSTWKHIFDRSAEVRGEEIELNQIFRHLPLALLSAELPENPRGAGLLMHISSLPSLFGIGDLGPEARNFAEYLSRGAQKYWQILPLNPTENVNFHSPYSSNSSMAGNTLFISPEILAGEGFLDRELVKRHELAIKDEVDFESAETVKALLLDEAYENFKNSKNSVAQFSAFCQEEAYWLDDFSCYSILKQKHKGFPWYKWPGRYRSRNIAALKTLMLDNEDSIRKIKWLQFIFFRQWTQLKDYCNRLNISILGDLPFYVSYDSADVWANPEIFDLDHKLKMTGIAGVPPDYFNTDGQFWGMPVFRWDKLKENDYDWWIRRLKKNMEMFDLLRLDHFRAFSAYWKVPAGSKNAGNGKWVPGPGADFFHTVKAEVGRLPFVAEDLGDVDEAVYTLRDEFAFPGMKVLQFAFGDDLPGSPYAPHNYSENFFVYSGTHDNNTSKGWFKNDLDHAVRKRFSEYAGAAAAVSNVNSVINRLAYASVANVAIIPMQDILDLDQEARMNTPASVQGNWLWRLLPGLLKSGSAQRIYKLAWLYNRI